MKFGNEEHAEHSRGASWRIRGGPEEQIRALFRRQHQLLGAFAQGTIPGSDAPGKGLIDQIEGNPWNGAGEAEEKKERAMRPQRRGGAR